jgi:hypothetical protein
MQLPFFLLMASILLSCSEKSNPRLAETSYWEKLKDSFATKNLESFVVDSQLQANYKNLHRVNNRVIDSVINYGTSYLYSWQESDSGLTAITTFVDDGEHGSRIIYFIFDGKDSLRSATQVANKGGEGGIVFETRSKFTAKDTLYKTSAATTQWDLSRPDPWSHPLSKSKGDSTFYHLIVLKDGKVVEKQFAEKKELNLE